MNIKLTKPDVYTKFEIWNLNIFNYTKSDKTPFTWCGIPKAVYSAPMSYIYRYLTQW